MKMIIGPQIVPGVILEVQPIEATTVAIGTDPYGVIAVRFDDGKGSCPVIAADAELWREIAQGIDVMLARAAAGRPVADGFASVQPRS